MARLEAFNRVGILINPVSTGANLPQTQANIYDLEEAFPGRTYRVFTDPSYDVSQDRIIKQSEPGDIITSHGGDSLAFVMANTLMRDDAPEGITYKAFRAGNGSEFAKMTGADCGLPANEALLQGDVRPVRPIKLTQEAPGKDPEVMRAFAYFGILTSALVSLEMINPSHRSHLLYKNDASRLAMEMYKTLAIGFTTPALHIERAGKVTTVQELSFVNGNIMGKLGRIPNKLDRDGVYGVAIPVDSEAVTERILAASHGAIALMAGWTAGFNIQPGEQLSYTVLDNTYTHADGEPFPVAAGTKMTVQPDPRSINVLFNGSAA